jgi:uncharacterized protein YbjT (DUF2867 family)
MPLIAAQNKLKRLVLLFCFLLTAQVFSQVTEKPIILVTGATGTQGGAVVIALLHEGFQVRGLTRNSNSEASLTLTEMGVEMVEGDFSDYASLLRAMQNVYGVFSVQQYRGIGTDTEVEYGMNIIEAAKASNVKHFIYTSVSKAHLDTGVPQFESKLVIENHLRSSGLPYTIFRPASFMTALIDLLNNQEGCNVSGPLPSDLQRTFIDPSDIGRFVFLAFSSPDQWIGMTQIIAGDKLSYQQIIETYNDIHLGCLNYQQLEWEDFLEDATETDIIRERWYLTNEDPFDYESFKANYPWTNSFYDFLLKSNH